ncbi:MFS transporter [Loigolactobacillus bifermentans]|jgi:EmrB/QacA subfamily drug resistance transporter|uniref:Proton-dependent transporter n=1 Tax=Loigolactobacillus bifermentans DSM 20003 TaxID=1423726 RepID=A0A0R1GM77_9LACO|nr:MFS transporter [Loigolactobacillus bifermentans]KRK35205.1 proton-dependent transporter [Loigolactobacillus bifermentans DSM 20003]QGG59879.1 MFS transporter [Loigolactobacillus bifermentans]
MSKQIKVAFLMAASLFMEIMDGTIVTTALPTMSKALQISTTSSALMISAYLITVAICIPLSGWISQRFGKKRIWLLAVAGFTLSSLGDALAVNFSMLLVMRILQGTFGSLMTPTARIIVLEKTKPEQLLVMTSYLVWPALLAPAIAPVAGGAILAVLNWRWIFLINLPIGVVIWFIGRQLIEADHVNEALPFDAVGFIAIAIMSISILGGFEAGTHGLAWAWLAGLLIVFGVLVAFFGYWHLKKSTAPLFTLDTMHIPSFRTSQISGFFLWLSVGAMPYLLTIFLQNIFHWSALKAGGYVLFIFVGNVSIKPATTPLIRNFGYKFNLLISFILIFASAAGLAFVTVQTPTWMIMGLAIISGAMRSLSLSSYNALCFADVPFEQRNDANTLNSVMQNLAQGLGISLVSIVIAMFSTVMAMAQAYRVCFVFLGLLVVYPIIETLILPKNIGAAAR